MGIKSDFAKVKNHTVIKRNGTKVPMDVTKIVIALNHVLPIEFSEEITRKVVNKLSQDEFGEDGRTLLVEEIQDCVEETLMQQGYYPEARAYISYRDEHKKTREKDKIAQITQDEINRVNQTLGYFPTPIQAFQFYDKYSKWDEKKQRRETWPETVDRTISFLKSKVDPTMHKLGQDTWFELEGAILRMEIMPSMRVLQMAGPALERCNVGAYNCAYLPIDSLGAFSELLYILMQGTGCGFSVESKYTSKLPEIAINHPIKKKTFVIEDTTEGWVDALSECISTCVYGTWDVTFDFSKIRPAGAVLKTKGGRASGSEPLKDLLNFVSSKIRSKAGNKLSTQDCHDICCYIGQIVQVGGVRRAAEISLSDLDDLSIQSCKSGAFWNEHPYRMMANNSAVYNSKPDSITFLKEWTSLAESGTGERGIYNRESIYKNLPFRRRDISNPFKDDFGINPCGEIILRPRQFCNLTMAVAREHDKIEDLTRKVKLATILGTIQSCLTSFSYLPSEWRANCEEERLLGVDITGQRDCRLFKEGWANSVPLTLEELRETAISINKEIALKLGIPFSRAITCAKPSGNSSQLLNCSSGIHARFAPFYIRRVRVGAYTPIAKLLIKSGVPYHPETGQSLPTASVLVFEFPVASPKTAITKNKLSALDQLNYWKLIKSNYTEHNPSCTISINKGEWIEAGDWVYKNFNLIGGLSFLPANDEHIYKLAPYEEITEQEYLSLSSSFPEIKWGELITLEREDNTTSSGEFACTSGACEL